jgi:hypothetical protein
MMNLPRWSGGGARRETGPGQNSRGRNATGLMPACEALDARQLLSTVAAAPVALSTPPAAAVANAAADLDALNPTTFARFQGDLAKAESRSNVNEAQVGQLAQDEAALDQMIESANLDPTTRLGHLDLQDVVASSFRESPSQSAKDTVPLDQYVVGVPGGTQLVRRTIEQMQVVSRATRITPLVRDAVLSDWEVLEYELGPSPDTDLGPGATDRDPLEVYFNGQVGDFIK